MNIKISIAEIIISFEFDCKIFRKEMERILDKFIVKTNRIDINIKLNMIKTYSLIDGKRNFFITDIKNDKIATIFQWNLKGELNLYNNIGNFNIYKEKPDFYSLVKFILLSVLPSYEGLLIHASSTISKNSGIIGAGVSGSGKSTFAKKLRTENFTILHDEITLIRKLNGSFYIFPTPFRYNPKHIVNFSEQKKLTSIFFLKQNKDNYINNISLKIFYKEMLKVIFAINKLKSSNYSLILDIINELYESVNIKELSFDLNQKLTDKLISY